MLRSIAGIVLVAVAGSASAQVKDVPARVDGVVELAGDAADKPVEAALGWVKFIAAGYRGAADHLGQGEAADAELALGGAMEPAVKTLLDALPGKKTKVRVNDAVEGTVTKIEANGIVLNVNKADVLVAWADVDPGKLAVLMLKGKPTAEPDVATIAMLKLLGGDAADAKRQAAKLTSELGKKLQELLDDWKNTGPEVAAARSLDAALREKDATKAIERFTAAWPTVKATKLGAEVAVKVRAQYVLRGEQAYAGEVGLKSAIHGKVKLDPARAHPAAGPGAVGIEIEFDFDKDAEAADFDPGTLPKTLATGLPRYGGASGQMQPLKAVQGRLVSEKVNGGMLPIAFGGDVEIQLEGGLREDLNHGGSLGVWVIGLAADNVSEMVQVRNAAACDVTIDGKAGPNNEKKYKPEELKPGMTLGVTLRVSGGKVNFARNEDYIQPLNFIPKKPLYFFLAMVGLPDWFCEHLIIKGTATRESLEGLAHLQAVKQATALFGE